MKNRSGFTLIETLVALAIAAILGLAFMNSTQILNAITSNSISQAGRLSLEGAIRQTMGRPEVCRAALTPTPFVAPSATAPGVTFIELQVATGNSTQTIASGATIAHYGVRVAQDGFRIIVPAGSTPIVETVVDPVTTTPTTTNIWTGVVELKSEKTKKGAAGGSAMASKVVSTVKIRVDSGGQIVGCQGIDSFACPEGMAQEGSTSSDCKTSDQILAEICAAGQIPISNGTTIDCQTPAQLFAHVCPLPGYMPVSNGAGGVLCKEVSMLTAVCGPCFIPVQSGSVVTCTHVPGCAVSVPQPLCTYGTCTTAGELAYNAALAKTVECTGGCWQPKSTQMLCLPPARVKKGDDEWMNFYQDNSMRRPYGSPCESVMRSASKHANLTSGGRQIRFDDTSKSCSTDKNCVEQ